jgi:hypothetical protein
LIVWQLQADVIGASSAELQGAEASFDVGSNGILVEDYEELLQNKAEKIREQLNGTCIFLIGMLDLWTDIEYLCL